MDLTSVLAKIGRAHGHAQTVRNEIIAWRDSEPYFITRDVNADLTVYRLIANIGVEPPLQKWTLIIGDFVHNLRSALDHLVYAVAIHESGKNPPPDENTILFPICETPELFKKNGRSRIKTLSLPVRTAIEACQPYNRRHPDLPPLLSILNSFEKTDKHKLISMAFTAVVLGKVGFEGPGDLTASSAQFFANAGEIKNGAEIIAATFDSPTPDMKFKNVDIRFVIALWHGKRDPSGPTGSDRTDFAPLLVFLIKEVRDVVRIVADAVK
jgi:hypothetical protein